MDTRDTCPTGFQGFPIQFTNWASLDKATITEANDIKLQFTPSQVPAKYEKETGIVTLNGGMSTFFMGGTVYTVQVAKFSKPKQEGISDFFNNTIVAEYQVWGIPSSSTAGNVPDLAVLVVPLKMDPVDTPAGSSILNLMSGKPVQLLNTIPQGRGTDIIRYSTCVETDNNDAGSKKTIRIAVAYWTAGAKYTQEQGVLVDARLGSSPFAPNGVPNILGYSLLTSYNTEVLEDGTRIKTDRQYTITKGVLQPYTPTGPKDLTTIQKKDGVFLIKDFQMTKELSNSTSNYKCVAIKPSRDIVNGQLQIDPSTGKRLDQELVDSEEQVKASLPQKPTSTATDTLLYALIGIGILIGVTILAGVLVVVGTWAFTRKSNNVAITEELAESLAASVKLPIGVTGGVEVSKP
jgi:hypothetical protein